MTLASFEKVLVANRGEIACRIFATCARLGIRTVAVHSDPDRDARHVRLASEARALGGAAARESYLAADRILEAAKASGATAVHPGYGFLSENAEFAEACAREGLVFIGPPVEAIRAMGAKSEAKALMERAGVPLVPGYHGEDQDPERFAREAEAIGYPVMLKASAGGGGRGMRIVREPAELEAALEGCRRESKAAFGDDRLLVERYLERPRHVEIQVFGDRHGSLLHLFERDCSIQRRHQKVIEEAPAPGLSPGLRAEMGQAAIEAARAVGYVGAGTVEFILAEDGTFAFMEMNTRLQVEHPVTELVTGLDLVEWQLRVAAGERLDLRQEDLELRGHAIEARLYAEDPAKGFLPSTGRLVHLAFPAESDHVRVDTGVEQGDAITPHYDPMIAKLVVWDETREGARRRLGAALRETRIAGVASNVDYLARVVAHERFAGARIDTGLLEEAAEDLRPAAGGPSTELWVAAVLSHGLRERAAIPIQADDPHSPWATAGPWRLNGFARRTLELGLAGTKAEPVAVSVEDRGDVRILEWAGGRFEAAGRLDEDGRLDAVVDGRRLEAWTVEQGDRLHVFLDGEKATFVVRDPLAHSGAAAETLDGLQSPMPGTVIALLVEPGTRVKKGAGLLVVEAMKMEHVIKAPTKGRVRGFPVAVGDAVTDGQDLVDFEPKS